MKINQIFKHTENKILFRGSVNTAGNINETVEGDGFMTYNGRCGIFGTIVSYFDTSKRWHSVYPETVEVEIIPRIQLNPLNRKKYIAWLKKQREQKTIEATDLRTWKYIVDAILTEQNGIGNYLDRPETEKLAKKLQERFGSIEQKFVAELNSFIESLGIEQPQGLHEAAVEYEQEFEKKTPWVEFDETHAHWFMHMFKAGAKWAMTEQDK